MKVKHLESGEVLEFKSLDAALRTLRTADGKPLLTTVKRATFAYGMKLFKDNGFELIRESVTDNASQLAILLSKLVDVEDKVNDALDLRLEELRGEISQALNEFKPLTHEIVVQPIGKPAVNMGVQHAAFEDLLMVISQRINVLMVGPAGSGKTTGAEKVSEALGLTYRSISVGAQTMKSEFFGYYDANGKYIRTMFRDAFEFGGVFLLDELDAGNANVLVSINQALANGQCGFPDGMVKKHADFVLIATANTWGDGNNRELVGRNQLDATTLNRFATLMWGYDDLLEESLCPNKDWLHEVRRVRAIVNEKKIRHVVSPRQSIDGAKLLAAGMSWKKVKELTLFKGLSATDRILLQ